MARTKAQLLLWRLKRTPWKRGMLIMGRYRLEILSTGKWYLCIDGTPKVGRRYQSVPGAKRAAQKALRALIRSEHGRQEV